MHPIELSVVMPCLNEAETLARCIEKAQRGFTLAGVQGEVIVADNGSTDGSQDIAQRLGARVVPVPEKGYGAALRGGIEAAGAEWVIMGDADDSYDFSEVSRFVEGLRQGHELVMGCRMPAGGGTIAPGAMPWKNRWIGNPFLSFLGRLFFRTPIRDFHCGMRGFTRTAYRRMELKTTGMEFASEMIMKASIGKLRFAEVPITLHKDGRSRPPHLRPWRDGWRHLRFMLIYSPRWLFLIPGLSLGLGGGVVALLAYFSSDLHGAPYATLENLTLSTGAVVVGLQLVATAFFTKVFGMGEGLLPQDRRFSRVFAIFTLERGMTAGIALFVLGFILLARCLLRPENQHPAGYIEAAAMRDIVAATSISVLGLVTVFSSFFMSVLGLKTVGRRPPDPAETASRSHPDGTAQ